MTTTTTTKTTTTTTTINKSINMVYLSTTYDINILKSVQINYNQNME